MPGKDNSKFPGWLRGLSRGRRVASPALLGVKPKEIQSSKLEYGHVSSKSSSATAEQSDPPRGPVNANPAEPGKDARVADNRPLATPSPAPSPAVFRDFQDGVGSAVAESTEIQVPALSTSQRLWNAAYDSVERENADLLRSYVKTLESVLGAGAVVAPETDISADLHDPAKRQIHMKMLVEEGQARISKASKITKQLGEVADAILSIKGIVDTAVQSVPQAALPWAGVCAGLQILLNPAQAAKSNLNGIAYVISRMEWYCALTEHLLSEDNIVCRNKFQAVLHQLEGSVVKLYKAVLLYQIKSIYMYHRNHFLVFFRDAEILIRNDTAQYLQEQTKIRLGDLVKHGEGVEAGLGNIHETLQDFISMQKSIQRDDIETACRRDLRVVDPQDDMDRIEGDKDELLDDAYQWILRTPEYASFTNWDNTGSERQQNRLLWIKGHAGTGKTMLMIGIIRELSHQPISSARALTYFFCQGTDMALDNATAILRSLIWLLLLQQPCLVSHLLQKHKEAGANLFRDRNAFYALSKAFQDMLKDSRLLPVYLAVDALDECTQGRSDFIRLISTSLTLSQKVRWLVSSRPEVDLPAQLGNRAACSLDASETLIELDVQRLVDPVNAYIDHKLNALRFKRGYSDSILADVSCEVRQRAENTFLWVALAFKVLESVHGRYAVKRIREMPPGLSKLYDHMIARIEVGTMIAHEHCKRVLAITSLLFRPPSFPELSILTGLPSDIVETAVEMCGSFLTATRGTVHLIHQSAKDYLEKAYTSRLEPAGPAQGHADIGRRSVDAMFLLKQNMYNLDFDSKPEDVTPPHPDPLAQIRYSCVFWAEHLCLESPECKKVLMDDGPVLGFLNERFLRWLESLSLLGKLSDGILSIRKLVHIVQSQPETSPRVTKLLQDAEKFILSHGSIIERAPLQVYGSALLFSPTTSKIRDENWKERLAFIKTAVGIREHWGAHRQTLEGHTGPVTAVAFSSDGKTLASASSDTTVRLWDAAGAHWKTLEGHSTSVVAMTFSPDGKTLASASGDGTIRLWDASGAYWKTLEGHSGAVWAVAFSPDGKTLASASADGSVRLWGVMSAHRQLFDGYTSLVRAVAFSPDGKTLALALDYGTVWFWDIAGAHWQLFDAHDNWVRALAFSPDGKTLVSASNDRTVRFWDAATGEHLQTLEGHSNWVMAIAFSLDGKTLASASCDETIRLWDAVTGAHLQTLEGHGDWVMAVAFSPDGKMLASASNDHTVRLWDAATGAYQQPLNGHSGAVWAVAFSPDGETLASAPDDGTIRLYDAERGAYRQTFKGHSKIVRALAFSPDGKTLASGSSDTTVRLWDAATGACWQTLERHGESVHAVAFSPDGNTLVSTTLGYRKVRLWDAATGALRQTFKSGVALTLRSQYTGTDRGLSSITWDPNSNLDADASKTFAHGKQAASGGYSVSGRWVVRDGKNFLWLPPSHMAASVAVHHSIVVIGHYTGEVTFLYFQ